jgi:NAD(P)H-dependent nitrite reductase small subunit
MNDLTGYQKACKLDELKEKIGKRFFINDVEIALFKIGEEVFALNNICPHQKARLIYEGFIENGNVVCPVHGWQFDLRTGKLAPDRKGLDSYDVKIENGDVFVKVFKKELNW